MMMAASAVALIALDVALAHDHQPPRTVLRHEGRSIQDGYLLQYCWVTSVENDVALTECTDNTWAFPRRHLVDPGDRIVIRIRKPSKPQDFVVNAWPKRGNEVAGPGGEAVSLPVVMSPRTVDEEIVAWNAVFTVDEDDRHYFIRAGGTWPDEQGAEVNQDAYWLFHIRT